MTQDATPTRVHFHLEVANYGRSVNLFAQTSDFARGDRLYRLAPVKFEQITEDEHFAAAPRPALTMLPQQAQQLMDELYRVGFRPAHGGLGDAERAAMSRHLEDMRRLVFDDAPAKVAG
jgi:hypothetical protein